MNKQDLGIIWCTHTWNAIFGCSGQDCEVSGQCYAKLVAERYKMPDFRKPQLIEQRLKEIQPSQKPRVIFVGSMADIMDAGFSNDQINKVIGAMNTCSQHTFMVLSKHPDRYADFAWPANVWLGTSFSSARNDCDTGRLAALYESYIASPLVLHTFISIEPLLGDLPEPTEIGPEVDWVIIGALTDAAGSMRGENIDRAKLDAFIAAVNARDIPVLVKPPLGKDYAPQFPTDLTLIFKEHRDAYTKRRQHSGIHTQANR